MAKAKGKEKPAASNVPADAEVTDINAQQTPSDPVKTEASTETTIDAECIESKEAEDIEEVDEDIEENSEEEEDAKENLEEEKEEEVKEDGTVEAAAPTVIAGDEKMDEGDKKEEMEEGDKKEEVKGDKKVEGAPKKKGKKIKKKTGGANATASNNADKTEKAAANKGKKKVDGMGLIFMCNSKTKQDCYQYKVLGLPESKKELVSSVYKGMRLFLYDIDLKLMYGIYKASSPGGYNLEPKAFKSAFPSQVRFTVLNDCIPLPEEKFKVAIKSNYFGRNRFNCELSPEQVKNLCKLFLSAGKVSSKQPSRFDGNNKRNAPTASSNGGRDRRGPPPSRRDSVRREGLSYQRRGGPAPLYPRKAPAYASPPLPLRRSIMMAPPPYDRPPVDDYYYRRDPLLAPPREHIFRDVEMRPVEYHDPFSMRGEPIPFQYSTYSAAVPPPSAYAPPHHMYRY